MHNSHDEPALNHETVSSVNSKKRWQTPELKELKTSSTRGGATITAAFEGTFYKPAS